MISKSFLPRKPVDLLTLHSRQQAAGSGQTHKDNVIRHTREALDLLWKYKTRDKRYLKSCRKALIYRPLSAKDTHAIAHGLEDLCEVGRMPKTEGKKGRRKRQASTTED